ncbi:MAG: hypothetical protein LBH30_03535 [Prevotellaceae bacterium]|jgi:hypothetical protein|nr:hypothetical protein [Prevotellaceae bacterium]
MILDTFQQHGIKRFVFILFCIIVLFGQKIAVVTEINSPQPVIPMESFLVSLTSANIYMSAFVKIALLLICSYGFLVTLSLHDTLPGKKYLAVMLFLCIVSVFTNAQNIVGSVCALFFQLFAFYNLFRTYHSNRVKSLVFLAAFFTGISILFSFAFSIAIINLIAGIWIFSVITWRTIISMLFGLLAPFMFLLCFFQLAYHDISPMLHAVENNFNSLFFGLFDFDNFSMIFIGLVFVITFFSAFKTVRYAKVIQKMINRLFYFLFITSFIIIIFVSSTQSYGIMLFGISSAYFLARFSQLVRRKWLAEFIVIAILIAAIAYNNYTLFL